MRAAAGGCKYASSFTSSRFIITSRVGYSASSCCVERWHFRWSNLAAHERKLHDAQQVEKTRVAELAGLQPRLSHLAAQHRFAAGENLLGHFFRRILRPIVPSHPYKNGFGAAADNTCACQSLAGIFSSARRAANATNRS